MKQCFQMKYFLKTMALAILFVAFSGLAKAQLTINSDSTTNSGTVTVHKDPRFDLLAKKEAEFNELLAYGAKSAKGYRLMVLSTSDRAQAMAVRAKLLQRYPDQKVYMSFQPPYIKLKFGNFLERGEADDYRKEIISDKLVSTNIYLVPEIIEIKPDKNKEKEIF